MNKVMCTFVHGKRGKWVLKNSLDYTEEELEIIIKAATAAKTRNQRHYEREAAAEREKAEKRKNRVGFFDRLFSAEEEV